MIQKIARRFGDGSRLVCAENGMQHYVLGSERYIGLELGPPETLFGILKRQQVRLGTPDAVGDRPVVARQTGAQLCIHSLSKSPNVHKGPCQIPRRLTSRAANSIINRSTTEPISRDLTVQGEIEAANRSRVGGFQPGPVR